MSTDLWNFIHTCQLQTNPKRSYALSQNEGYNGPRCSICHLIFRDLYGCKLFPLVTSPPYTQWCYNDLKRNLICGNK